VYAPVQANDLFLHHEQEIRVHPFPHFGDNEDEDGESIRALACDKHPAYAHRSQPAQNTTEGSKWRDVVNHVSLVLPWKP